MSTSWNSAHRLVRSAGMMALVALATRSVRAQEDGGAATPAASEPPAAESSPGPDSAPLDVAPATPRDPAPVAVDAVPVEVTVRAASKAQTARESARAVDVIELDRAHRESADLGQVLARSEGLNVRRFGALGADARLFMNGLSDDQIRVFIDGVPLELAGYPFGLVNVPVELVDRVEVHRGVVPVRLGADTLGGAIELVSSDKTRGTHANASYQAGSFDTHRLLLSARHRGKGGVFVRAEGFFDKAENDYPIEQPVQDRVNGGTRNARVYREHDGYRAGFGAVEAGFVNRSWARRLTLRGFVGDRFKEIQSTLNGRVPFGEVTQATRTSGVLLRYESVPFAGFTASMIAGYAARRNVFEDLASCLYDWNRECTRDISPARGERPETTGADQHVTQHSGYARALLARPLGDVNVLRLSTAPTYTGRRGENRALAPDVLDPLSARRELLTVISGVELQTDVFSERLQNLAFFKHYVLSVRGDERLGNGTFSPADRTDSYFGGGDALRFRLTEQIYVKASYEYATRLPSPDQIFGDGALVETNMNLRPETSHNANLGLGLSLPGLRAGDLRAQVSAFARRVDDLIVEFLERNSFRFENVNDARSLGVEGSVAWTSPGRYVSLDGNATYQDYRNVSTDGRFGRHEGDRIPYRPYLLANGSAQLFARGLLPEGDELSLTWRTGYVHAFMPNWEGLAPGGTRLHVPSQLTHALGLTLLMQRGKSVMSATLEVFNLTDERVYDFYGVQRPGRSMAAKFTIGV